MLSNFPPLYPDELVLSGIARYHQRSINKGFRQTLEDLFGDHLVCATVDLPSHLNVLVERLNHAISVQTLINDHTLLPYYTPFISENRYNNVFSILEHGAPWGVAHAKLGLLASGVKNPSNLRYCYQCYIEDCVNFGEPFWHRVHQIPGVIICPIHKNYLTETHIAFPTRDHKYGFIPLSNIKYELPVSPLAIHNERSHLLYIAEQSMQILESLNRPIGQERLRQLYIAKLGDLGYVSAKGGNRIHKLITNFTLYYGDDFLQFLGGGISLDNQDTWLHKLLRDPQGSCHPLRHLLLLGFIGEDTGFYSRENSYLPFGSGPWPCLNKASGHYRELVINDCIITPDYKTRLPVGTFSCQCGFVYSRRGPDRKEEDRFRYGRIKEFGHVWMEKLGELKQAGNQSLRGMARLLGVDPGTVKAKLTSDSVETNENIERDNSTELYKRRDRMLQTITNNQGKSRTEIRTLNKKDYGWLYRHDRDWLMSYLPQKMTKEGNYKSDIIDWDARDEMVYVKIKQAIKEIKAFDTPIRFTKASIGRFIDQRNLIDYHLNKMPKSKTLLENYVESTEEFQLRRLEWAANQLKIEDKLSGWRLMRLAGIPEKISFRVVEKMKDLLTGYDDLYVSSLINRQT